MSNKAPKESLPRAYPYAVGQSYILTKHSPAAAAGPPSKIPFDDMVDVWGRSARKEYCASRFPIPGTPAEGESLAVTITGHVRAGDGKGAQIVITDDDRVAKIYDPLYYPCWGYKAILDVVGCSDYDYYHEATAYAELQGTDADAAIPRYHGSHTMEVQDEIGPRKVAVILMEYIRGPCMLDVDVEALTPRQREDALAKVLEADVLVDHNGVWNDDLHPRNVMLSLPAGGQLSPADFSSPELRATIIDFGRAKLRRHSRSTYDDEIVETKMANPAWLYWNKICWFQEAGWITKEQKKHAKWLWERYHGDERYCEIMRSDGGWIVSVERHKQVMAKSKQQEQKEGQEGDKKNDLKEEKSWEPGSW